MQPEPRKVGLIEDDPIMGESIVQRLKIEGWTVKWWRTGADALGSKWMKEADVIVCDIRLPDMSGEEVYRHALGSGGTPPFIFITGYGEIDQAVRLMRMGAADYLLKPFVFEEFHLRLQQNRRRNGNAPGPDTISLGTSPQMRETEKLIARYAPNDLPVLITGETGVGKEVTARLLHRKSDFATGPFMAVNCAAIPEDLLESEIFGHERGAFTGADKQHLGYAERTKKGTLFLDEIGDMPISLQAKILRLVEERKFFRVGGEQTITFKGRIIAATHHDLPSESGTETFREDLYYRLAVLPLHLAPLRERPDDILEFMNRFLDEACSRQNRSFKGYSSIVEEIALQHPWRGNVRELRSRVERAVAVGQQPWILPEDMFPDKAHSENREDEFESLARIRHDAERRHIERALSKTDGQTTETARLLGISRTTLWEKMNRLGIKTERSEN
jgi:two-component system response regulator HydG